MPRQGFSRGTAADGHTPSQSTAKPKLTKTTTYDYVHQIFITSCTWFRRGVLCDRGFSSNGFDVRSKGCCGGGGRGGRGSGGGGNELDFMADTYIINMRLVKYRIWIWIWWNNLLKFIAVCRNKCVLLHAALCNREMLWCDLLQII